MAFRRKDSEEEIEVVEKNNHFITLSITPNTTVEMMKKFLATKIVETKSSVEENIKNTRKKNLTLLCNGHPLEDHQTFSPGTSLHCVTRNTNQKYDFNRLLTRNNRKTNKRKDNSHADKEYDSQKQKRRK